jgi:hypothetical protein
MVLGADQTGRLPDLAAATGGLCHADTGERLESLDDVDFAAAYLGAFPIVEALEKGADVVITERVADTSVFMAPAIHELGVARDDWERLGRLAIMGHLLECSAQVSGGNFSGPISTELGSRSPRWTIGPRPSSPSRGGRAGWSVPTPSRSNFFTRSAIRAAISPRT